MWHEKCLYVCIAHQASRISMWKRRWKHFTLVKGIPLETVMKLIDFTAQISGLIKISLPQSRFARDFFLSSSVVVTASFLAAVVVVVE